MRHRTLSTASLCLVWGFYGSPSPCLLGLLKAACMRLYTVFLFLLWVFFSFSFVFVFCFFLLIYIDIFIFLKKQ